ncbi:MAG TPA: hypothetical protein VJ724_15990 [Tahibacter sp.]|nr:hypothetical protein [Tahibacter sp.]
MSIARTFAALAFAVGGAAHAATITIVSADGAGEGFNDASAPPANAGCNAGETLGACRLRVFNVAATQWGALLVSNVPILVSAKMDPQTCTQNSATLGSAGPVNAFANFTNRPRANTSYVVALANSYAGSDLSAGNPDINATFNVSIDTGCFGNRPGWWYGTNPNVAPLANRLPLLPVVFHELAHGLGFSSLYDGATGAALTSQPPIWGAYLYDLEASLRWNQMTDGQRAASAINDPDLVWAGPKTSRWGEALLTAGRQGGCVRMHAPATFVAGSSVSHFSTATTPNLLMEPALNTSLFDKVDLTLPLFQDIGWRTGVETFLFVDGFDKPCPVEQP